jgi:arsenite-transporting ATPase
VADLLFGPLPGEDPVAAGTSGTLLRVEPDGEDYVLHVRLPLAQRPDVEAVRAGDDLVLTVAGHRRVLALPSVLRRCDVAGGSFAADVLSLRFRRNPDLWPEADRD